MEINHALNNINSRSDFQENETVRIFKSTIEN